MNWKTGVSRLEKVLLLAWVGFYGIAILGLLGMYAVSLDDPLGPDAEALQMAGYALMMGVAGMIVYLVLRWIVLGFISKPVE
ncbi:MAG: hypothetical protein V4579_09855 [Pseudomonadota bacterium]